MGKRDFDPEFGHLPPPPPIPVNTREILSEDRGDAPPIPLERPRAGTIGIGLISAQTMQNMMIAMQQQQQKNGNGSSNQNETTTNQQQQPHSITTSIQNNDSKHASFNNNVQTNGENQQHSLSSPTSPTNSTTSPPPSAIDNFKQKKTRSSSVQDEERHRSSSFSKKIAQTLRLSKKVSSKEQEELHKTLKDLNNGDSKSSANSQNLPVVLYNYLPTNEKMLAVSKGEQVEILYSVNKHWAKVQYQFRVGLFPISYLRIPKHYSIPERPAVEGHEKSTSKNNTSRSKTIGKKQGAPKELKESYRQSMVIAEQSYEEFLKGLEMKKYEDLAKQQHPPPFPKPEFKKGGSKDEYKEFMIKKFEYEAWENSIVLLARKLKDGTSLTKSTHAPPTENNSRTSQSSDSTPNPTR